MADDFALVNAPDGTQIRFPASMSNADIEKAMEKLYPAPESNGDTMLAKSQQQAKEYGTRPLTKAADESGQGAMLMAGIARQDKAPANEKEANDQLESTIEKYAADEAGLYSSAFAPSPQVAAKTILYGSAGAVGGKYAGEGLGYAIGGKKLEDLGGRAGSIIGGLAGGYRGATTAEPVADEVAQAVRQRRASWIPTKVKTGIGKVGSEAQESGYYPAVTKVPIRPDPPYRLTPESVPGPDTAGKGNLLTPLAKRGDSRAAMEVARRGRPVLFTPAESYAPPRSTTTFPTEEQPMQYPAAPEEDDEEK